nr:MAG TPA: hypothetical protein [Caudoviricetes sp.]
MTFLTLLSGFIIAEKGIAKKHLTAIRRSIKLFKEIIT